MENIYRILKWEDSALKHVIEILRFYVNNIEDDGVNTTLVISDGSSKRE